MTETAAPETPVEKPIIVLCTAGPNKGKRFKMSEVGATLGRSPECEVYCPDMTLAERHAVFVMIEGEPTFHAIGGSTIYDDGKLLTKGVLKPNQQLRIGGSTWQIAQIVPTGTKAAAPPTPVAAVASVLNNMTDKITSVAGGEKLQGFDFTQMFSAIFQKRSDEEIETYFNVGSASTTPEFLTVPTAWPKPWAFFKAFVLSTLIYFGFFLAINDFGNPKLMPGLILIGAFAIPFSVLIFFFEVNVVRNISLYQVIKLLFLGGILSLVVSLTLFSIWDRNTEQWLGAASAGLIEEIAKLLALLLVVNQLRYRWLLNGMLFGAAVGAGFGVFETAGFAYVYGKTPDLASQILTQRGIFCIFGGHVLWTALVGAALWKVRDNQEFHLNRLQDVRFLRVFGLVFVMDFLWNSPLPGFLNLKYIILGFVAWVAILSLLQEGLKQIRTEQARLKSLEESSTQNATR